MRGLASLRILLSRHRAELRLQRRSAISPNLSNSVAVTFSTFSERRNIAYTNSLAMGLGVAKGGNRDGFE